MSAPCRLELNVSVRTASTGGTPVRWKAGEVGLRGASNGGTAWPKRLQLCSATQESCARVRAPSTVDVELSQWRGVELSQWRGVKLCRWRGVELSRWRDGALWPRGVPAATIIPRKAALSAATCAVCGHRHVPKA